MIRSELDANSRSFLYQQLARAEHAGLPWRRLPDALEGSASKTLVSAITTFTDLLSRGRTLVQAGQQSGLFLPWEARLVRSAEQSGDLERCFAGLSKRHAQRARRNSGLRNAMVFPLALLVIATFLAPLASLFTGQISGTQYLLITVGRLSLFFGGLFLLSWAWRRLGASGMDSGVHGLILKLPFFGTLMFKLQQRDFLDTLAMALDAGMPAFDALTLASDSVSNPRLRKKFAAASQLARNGLSVTESIRVSGVIQDTGARNLARSGEFSGRLEEMLHHIVAQLDEQVESRYEVITDWTPRVAYALVIGLILAGI